MVHAGPADWIDIAIKASNMSPGKVLRRDGPIGLGTAGHIIASAFVYVVPEHFSWSPGHGARPRFSRAKPDKIVLPAFTGVFALAPSAEMHVNLFIEVIS